MLNKIILIGRLTKDPELRTSANGVVYVNFSIAVDRKPQEGVDFFNCIAFSRQAENLANFMYKGSLIGVEGKLQNDSYEKDGEKRLSTRVVCDNITFLERKKQSQEDSKFDQDSEKSISDLNDITDEDFPI